MSSAHAGEHGRRSRIAAIAALAAVVILAIVSGVYILGSAGRADRAGGGVTGRADARTVSTAASLKPCTSGTCWVAVSVATMWVKPWYPRPVDQPALANPARPRQWIHAMTTAQKSWLVGRLESQALYGTRVIVIDHHGADWTRIAVPSQPTNRDGRGYPGWVPTGQLTGTPPPAARTMAIVRSRTASLWSSWTSAGVSGSEVMELSYDTACPSRGHVHLRRGSAHRRQERRAEAVRDVALHTSGLPWGATAAKVVSEARKFLGLQYLWGGTSGFGFDCSGFTRSATWPTAWRCRATPTGRPCTARRREVGAASRRPGVLPREPQRIIGHVGMYVGSGNMIDAPKPRPGSDRADRLVPPYAGARRYLSK